MDRALLEDLVGEGLSLAEIGRRVGRHESTIAHWLSRYELRAANRDKHSARGALSRDVLAALVDAGASIAEIATAVDRSKGTVRHWLREYGLQTQRSAMRGVPAEYGAGERPEQAMRTCSRHGMTAFKLRAEGGYRCLKCRSDAVVRRRRKVKRLLVQEAGGCCRLCGYDRCIAALEFHHLRPNEKQFELSRHGVARSLARARVEAAKCVLLCANCHAEVEAGVRTLA
jgi:transposase